MRDLQIFQFEAAQVRTVVGEGGEPLFVGKDVCDVLGYSNAADAMNKHCKGVAIRYPLQTTGGIQEFRVLTEGDVMRLVVRSKLPAAEKFEQWVFDEVLPAIRKTGRYGAAPAADPMQVLNDPAAMRGLLLGYTERVIKLEAEVAAQAPKVEAFERMAQHGEGSFCITDAAKNLQIMPRKLFGLLSERKWIYRRPMGSGWLGYQDRIQAGLLEHKVTTGTKPDGSEWTETQVRITARGLARLAELLSKQPPPPPVGEGAGPALMH